jgi:hypothetical protein
MNDTVSVAGEPRGKTRLGALLLALVGIAIILLAVWVILMPRPNRNALVLGDRAKVTTLDIGIQPPAELDSKTRAEVLQLRREAALRYPGLLAGSYEPSDAVFGQIQDGLPWWGIAGQFFYGSGGRSIDGPSEETRFILNPYLLVAADFNGLSIWSRTGSPLVWDKARISESLLDRPDFPLTCLPSTLRWRPREARAEVTYFLSGCLAAMNRWTARPLTVAQASFDLIAYNARDLNLNYLYVLPEDSLGLAQDNLPTAPVAIPQFIHKGNSCGYPGGCNNMSPYVQDMSGVRIERLPAEAMIHLWARRPKSVGQKPDMVFVMRFE